MHFPYGCGSEQRGRKKHLFFSLLVSRSKERLNTRTANRSKVPETHEEGWVDLPQKKKETRDVIIIPYNQNGLRYSGLHFLLCKQTHEDQVKSCSVSPGRTNQGFRSPFWSIVTAPCSCLCFQVKPCHCFCRWPSKGLWNEYGIN